MEAEIVEDGGDGFGVAEFAGANPIFDLARCEGANGDAFVGFGMRRAGAKIARDVNDHAFADEAGGGEEVENFLPAARGVAGFFEEFALRAEERQLARLDASGDEFPKIASHGMAILADEEQTAVVEDGKDDDGAVVDDEVAGGADSAGLDDRVAPDAEDAAAEESLGGDDFGASDGVPPMSAGNMIRGNGES